MAEIYISERSAKNKPMNPAHPPSSKMNHPNNKINSTKFIECLREKE